FGNHFNDVSSGTRRTSMTRQVFPYTDTMSEQQKPRWLNAREQHAWRGYLDLHARLTARLHRQLLTDSGLSLSDFDVLVQLTDRAEPRMRMGELADGLQWEQSRLSHHIARMHNRGLVDRASCPEDARVTYVALTDQGRQDRKSRGAERPR